MLVATDFNRPNSGHFIPFYGRYKHNELVLFFIHIHHTFIKDLENGCRWQASLRQLKEYHAAYMTSQARDMKTLKD